MRLRRPHATPVHTALFTGTLFCIYAPYRLYSWFLCAYVSLRQDDAISRRREWISCCMPAREVGYIRYFELYLASGTVVASLNRSLQRPQPGHNYDILFPTHIFMICLTTLIKLHCLEDGTEFCRRHNACGYTGNTIPVILFISGPFFILQYCVLSSSLTTKCLPYTNSISS